jgi:hypothetical protein
VPLTLPGEANASALPWPFHFNLEHELWKLHEELTAKTYRPGAYRSFFIYEPKKRQISAAPYRVGIGSSTTA